MSIEEFVRHHKLTTASLWWRFYGVSDLMRDLQNTSFHSF